MFSLHIMSCIVSYALEVIVLHLLQIVSSSFVIGRVGISFE